MTRFLWTQKARFGPMVRLGAAAAYHADRLVTVLFGGDSLQGAFFGDTWGWDGTGWTQLDDKGPSARRDHGLVYDANRKLVLLFGGRGTAGFLGDTWQWDGDHWTQVADTGPGARARHAMAFDSVRSRTVLFGGSSGTDSLGDTWEFDGDTWTQQENVGPSPRAYPAMAFEAAVPRILLFGGASASGALADTWAWNGVAWSEVTGFGPPPCANAGMVSMGDAILVFGGFDADGTNPRVFGDTWVFDGTYWTERQDFGPGPRWGHAMAFDTVRQQVVVFGGLSVVEASANSAPMRLGDTWEHFEEAAAIPPLAVQTLVFSPPTALPGQSVTAIVTLNAAAPAGGVGVHLSFLPLSQVFSPQLTTPLTVIPVPAGAVTAQAIIMSPGGQHGAQIFAAVGNTPPAIAGLAPPSAPA